MKQQQPLNIMMLGDPGAGKGTQAQFLIKKYRMTDIDIGKEMRKLWATNKALSKKYSGQYNRGNVGATEVAQDIYRKKIFGTSKNKGIMFNGGPKKLNEVKLVLKWLKELQRQPLVFYVHIPLAERRKRMLIRKEVLLGKLKRRTEDSPEVLANRFKQHRKNVTEVVKYLQPRYKVNKISGLGTRQQVHKKIQKVIDQYLKQREKAH